jgi:hypothetical protein
MTNGKGEKLTVRIMVPLRRGFARLGKTSWKVMFYPARICNFPLLFYTRLRARYDTRYIRVFLTQERIILFLKILSLELFGLFGKPLSPLGFFALFLFKGVC